MDKKLTVAKHVLERETGSSRAKFLSDCDRWLDLESFSSVLAFPGKTPAKTPLFSSSKNHRVAAQDVSGEDDQRELKKSSS